MIGTCVILSVSSWFGASAGIERKVHKKTKVLNSQVKDDVGGPPEQRRPNVACRKFFLWL